MTIWHSVFISAENWATRIAILFRRFCSWSATARRYITGQTLSIDGGIVMAR